MLTKFELGDSGLLLKAADSAKRVVWIDVLSPSAKERAALKNEYNIDLPLHHETHQLEFSNRFYHENDALYLSVHVVTKASPLPQSHIITYIHNKNVLVTLRYSDPNPIETFIEQLETRKFYAKDTFEVFLLLLNKVVGTIADIFEIIDEKAEELSIFLVGSTQSVSKSNQNKHLNKTLLDINYLESLLGKSYQSLSSLRLLISFFDETQHDMFSAPECMRLDSLAQDIESLSKHAEHLTQKFNFQLQSTLGLINVEQTQIIKIFTVLAMIFMPPTLIASIYGMNFKFMPELFLSYGYPLALTLMIITALVPYRLFKRKGWI
ncbi:MAG: CorA family divalent cation transporter [Candidatus Berkiella sp.]